jgi:hypothetical protein
MPRLCGVWPGVRGLTAVLVEIDGTRQACLTVRARTEEDCWTLLVDMEQTEGLDWELVLPDWLARSGNGGVAQLALSRGITVWVAPTPVVEGVRLVGGLSRAPAARVAAAIARLPLSPLFRTSLRKLVPVSRHQLPLL